MEDEDVVAANANDYKDDWHVDGWEVFDSNYVEVDYHRHANREQDVQNITDRYETALCVDTHVNYAKSQHKADKFEIFID